MRGDPPKESLGEDLLELVLSLYPPTALAGIALSADDAYYAVKDMIQNPEEIGFNRNTLDNALDIFSVFPGGRTAAKTVDLGKGMVQMAQNSRSLKKFAALLDTAGFMSDRSQSEGEPTPPISAPKPLKSISPKQIESRDLTPSIVTRTAPKPLKRIQPKQIESRDGVRSLVPRPAPKPLNTIQPKPVSRPAPMRRLDPRKSFFYTYKRF